MKRLVYLVRHARATEREGWTRADRLRPLSAAGDDQAVALVRSLRTKHVKILERLRADGVPLRGGLRLPKASIWVLELDGTGEVTAASYRPPPA